MTDPYAIDAEFYDQIHAHQGDEDVGLWLSYAGRTDRPVLEVGCGTGRIALALARAGHEVTGLDPSHAMLARARRRAEDDAIDVTFVEGSAGEVLLTADEYGFVLIPADVFLYCEDGEEQRATLGALRAAMHFNAVLAIDLPGPANGLDPSFNGQPVLAWSGELGDGRHLHASHVREDDLATQTRELEVIYDIAQSDGLVRRQTSRHSLRYVHRFEAEYLLQMAGLALSDVYGDYDLGPLTNDSERMILIARRAGG